MQTRSNWSTLVHSVNGSNLCIGVDPHKDILANWGLKAHAEDLNEFCRKILKLVEFYNCECEPPSVAALKPQSAFFESFGHGGIKELGKLLVHAQFAKVPSILDVKRGDIGSTMHAYCDAYLNPESPLSADSITVSAFLGTTELKTVAEYARKVNRGIFVLCRISNAGADEFQNARINNSTSVAERILDFAYEFNKSGDLPTVGLVVGATIGENNLDFTDFNGPILAPGIGAQGATFADLSAVFGLGVKNVLPSASRSILKAGPKLDNMVTAVRKTLHDEDGNHNERQKSSNG
ncbi:MAG: orotidine-5'-phosphate decarboxylase [Candidatus Ancillula trichonymphae]|nr:orotidine-5'-phosphate decarboxylase [Candidatus Ancillula trichonymphae]